MILDETTNSPENRENLEENSLPEHNELDICRNALADWQDKYARLLADFDNYKKRTVKEQASFALHAQSQLLINLLSIVDNFDRAMAHQPATGEPNSSWIDGIAMIYTSFKDLLTKSGVKEVSYDSFNPEFHDALMQVESPDHYAGQIVSVLEKGYILGDRVLRPAKVSVAK